MFESCGLMHKSLLDFLEQLAVVAAETKRIPKGVLLNFFVKRLSLCLQDGLANSLMQRMSSTASHSSSQAFDPSFSLGVILDV